MTGRKEPIPNEPSLSIRTTGHEPALSGGKSVDLFKAESYFRTWESVCGREEAIDWALRSLAKLWHERRELKQNLANARRELTRLRKKSAT